MLDKNENNYMKFYNDTNRALSLSNYQNNILKMIGKSKNREMSAFVLGRKNILNVLFDKGYLRKERNNLDLLQTNIHKMKDLSDSQKKKLCKYYRDITTIYILNNKNTIKKNIRCKVNALFKEREQKINERFKKCKTALEIKHQSLSNLEI